MDRTEAEAEAEAEGEAALRSAHDRIIVCHTSAASAPPHGVTPPDSLRPQKRGMCPSFSRTGYDTDSPREMISRTKTIGADASIVFAEEEEEKRRRK